MSDRCVILCILDGVGWGRRDRGDAVFMADTPTLDHLMQEHPWRLLLAHGKAVGMPSDKDMGNSEVGHNAMGAGRIFEQGASLINKSLQSAAQDEDLTTRVNNLTQSLRITIYTWVSRGLFTADTHILTSMLTFQLLKKGTVGKDDVGYSEEMLTYLLLGRK